MLERLLGTRLPGLVDVQAVTRGLVRRWGWEMGVEALVEAVSWE
jgi:hypothetical protein